MTAILAGLCALLLWWAVLSPRTSLIYGYAHHRAQSLSMLRSHDPEQRKRGAWRLIDFPDPLAIDVLRNGIFGDERDPAVREAYVYALGRLRSAPDVAAVEFVIDDVLGEAGDVRSAAWLAAARIDAEHFRLLATAEEHADEAWTQIGIAQGRLFLDDTSKVNTLLHWAGAGDLAQRIAAGRALANWLRPLLDSVGRWPLDAALAPHDPWPAALVDEITARCRLLDLQTIAADLATHVRAAAGLRSQLARITSARERLARLLFWE